MKSLVIAALLMLAVTRLDAQAPAFAPGPVSAGRADSIAAARELYASARYDEALAVLNGLSSSDSTRPAERKVIEQYRSLCLLALGRGEEAEAAIAAVIRVDPFYQPSEAEASPRVRSTFSDVRERLLPDLVASRYADAKQAYDRKQFAEAAGRFRELLRLLEDPQMNGRLPDLRTLTAGFVELAAAAAAPPAPPKPEEPASAPAVPTAPAGAEPRIYTAEEPGIVPPVIIRQDVPTVPSAISGMTRTTGVLDLVIDEKGRVISLNLRARLHPLYDTALVNAAREWKYRPAKLNGVPVRFRKIIQISVKR
jgi:hypothetical protein